MKKLLAQLVAFGIVGIVATGIDFAVLFMLHQLFGLDSVVASVISFVVSLVFNYVASMRYVFERRSDISRAHEFVLFVILSLVGLALNSGLMFGGRALFEAQGIAYEQSQYYLLVKVFATAVVMGWNFISRKLWLDAGREA